MVNKKETLILKHNNEISKPTYKPERSKSVAVILAVFLSFWTWAYTYKYDSWKFWLNLVLSFTIIWIPIAWIWAIVDASNKDKKLFTDYHK